ncbi:NYN domain-containing protein [Bradyrhizobium ottawaense]|uniref:LabA-like NYN domain-containing protein n=1 Tax=Bradyrhizobium ottawaense TaxID=931866 RepID=UPI001FE0CB1D|nr:NYN domain-containing protein [Bradyrhizobium ottawaense]
MADRTVDRIALFIDGLNLYSTSKALGFEVDHRRLLKQFESYGKLLRAFYYARTTENQELGAASPFIDWLGYNGFSVVSKPTVECIGASGERRLKWSMDVDLAVDAMEFAGRVDRIVLFSSDGNLCRLVQAVQRRGVHVTVVSTAATEPAMVSRGLRRQADAFIDLADLKPKICRVVISRPRVARGADRSARCGPAAQNE